MLSEKQIDSIIESAFQESPDFIDWFLSKTKFSGLNAKCVWSRSDQPWGRFTFTITDSETGKLVEVTRDSETDILVVLEDIDKKKFAFHIENKLADGHFTLYQPDMFKMRADAWLNSEKFGDYSEFETILIAPLSFYKNNIEASKPFDRYISYEETSLFIPELVGNCKWPIQHDKSCIRPKSDWRLHVNGVGVKLNGEDFVIFSQYFPNSKILWTFPVSPHLSGAGLWEINRTVWPLRLHDPSLTQTVARLSVM